MVKVAQAEGTAQVPKRKKVWEPVDEDELGPELVEPNTIFKRECLRCDRKFETKNKFNRLCGQCSKWANFVDAPGIDAW
jgi:hypothetical protein